MKKPTIIHVNRNKLRARDACCISVRLGKNGKATYSKSVVIRDDRGLEVAVVSFHEQPLKCGARVWIEVTNGTVTRQTPEQEPDK